MLNAISANISPDKDGGMRIWGGTGDLANDANSVVSILTARECLLKKINVKVRKHAKDVKIDKLPESPGKTGMTFAEVTGIGRAATTNEDRPM